MNLETDTTSLIRLEPTRLVAALEAQGKLLRVSREVDPRFELSAVIHAIQKGPNLPVLFESVKNCRYPVLSNVNGSYGLVASMIGANPNNLAQRWAALMERNLADLPKEVADPPGETEEIGLLDLPQLVFAGKDDGPYITAGIFVVRDPATGVQNLSYHRSQIISPSEIRCRLRKSEDLVRIQQAAADLAQTLTDVM